MYSDSGNAEASSRTDLYLYLVMPFRSLEECADMVPKVLELPFVPTAIEFLERELIDIVERNLNKMFR